MRLQVFTTRSDHLYRVLHVLLHRLIKSEEPADKNSFYSDEEESAVILSLNKVLVTSVVVVVLRSTSVYTFETITDKKHINCVLLRIRSTEVGVFFALKHV